MSLPLKKPVAVILIAASTQGAQLVETLRSIDRQDHRNVRVVLVLDPAENGAIELARSYKARSSLPVVLLINQEILGESFSLNRGLAWVASQMKEQIRSSTSLLFATEDDTQLNQGSVTLFGPGDLALSDCLVHTFGLLTEHPDAHFIYGGGLVSPGVPARSPAAGALIGWSLKLSWLASLQSTALFDADNTGGLHLSTLVRLVGAGAAVQRRTPVFKAGSTDV